MYKLTLTHEEENLLTTMHYKGYDCGMCDALDDEEVTFVTSVEYGTFQILCTFTIPEHVIWPVFEAWCEALDGHNDPWGPFVAETLRPKLDKLMSEVV